MMQIITRRELQKSRKPEKYTRISASSRPLLRNGFKTRLPRPPATANAYRTGAPTESVTPQKPAAHLEALSAATACPSTARPAGGFLVTPA